MHQIVQTAYQDWLKKQSADVKNAPKTLYWGQADWFFDGEGVGLHYQANQITKDAPQLDIYLTTEQTKKYYNLRFMNKCSKLVAEFATYL